MNKLKQLWPPYLIVLAALVVATGALWFWQRVRPEVVIRETPPAQPVTVADEEIPGLVLDARLLGDEMEGNLIELVIYPQTKPVILSAFALQVTLTPAGAGHSLKLAGELTPNPELATEDWTFPIVKATVNQDGSLVLGLSGAHLAKQPFLVAGEQVLATVPVEGLAVETVLSQVLDQEITRFWTDDTVRTIPVLTRP